MDTTKLLRKRLEAQKQALDAAIAALRAGGSGQQPATALQDGSSRREGDQDADPDAREEGGEAARHHPSRRSVAVAAYRCDVLGARLGYTELLAACFNSQLWTAASWSQEHSSQTRRRRAYANLHARSGPHDSQQDATEERRDATPRRTACTLSLSSGAC